MNKLDYFKYSIDSQNVKKIIKSLESNGGVVIENVLSPCELSQLTQDVDEILGNTKNCEGYFYGFSTKRVACMVSKSEICQGMAINDTVLKVMDHFLLPHCSDYQLNLSQLISIGAGERQQIIHADDPMYPFDHDNNMQVMLNVMWAIDDFTNDNGATLIAPKSHLWERERHPKPEELIQASMKKGSCFIWLGSTRHGGGANKTLSSRRGIVMSYNLGWLKQADNYFLSIDRDDVKSYPHKLQRLLGYFVHKPNLNMVEGRDPQELLTKEGLHDVFTEYMPEGVEDLLKEHYTGQNISVSKVTY